MNKIRVVIRNYNDLDEIFIGLRICTDTIDKVTNRGEDIERNTKLVKKALSDEVPHLSVLKHLIYHIYIEGIPRSLLQELVRHQIGVAINVLSTRWALHKIFSDPELNNLENDESRIEFVKKYYFVPPELEVFKDKSETRYIYESWFFERLDELLTMRKLRKEYGYKNDKLKHLINENLRTKVYMTISALALRNMFNQRLYKDAWYPFRYLMRLIWKELPDNHRILYEDIVYKNLKEI